MTNAKEIKKRSRSISSIKKITKAMELVSAAKMRRAVDAVLKTRTYANLSWETLLNIVQSAEASKEETKHPLLEQRLQNERELIILFVLTVVYAVVLIPLLLPKPSPPPKNTAPKQILSSLDGKQKLFIAILIMMSCWHLIRVIKIRRWEKSLL